MRRFYILMIFLLFIDLGTKTWAESHLFPGKAIQVSGIMNFTLVHNRGVGFGLFASDIYLVYLLELTGVIAVMLFLHPLRSKHPFWGSAAQVLIVSGAAGNLINRVISGYVIDFIAVKSYPFVFNAADIEIRIGVLLFIYLLVKEWLKKAFYEKRIKA
jgi:lipoprotein signal peptidase